MLSVKLKMKLKSGEIKEVFFEKVTDLYVDYENNKFSLYDYNAGVVFPYHFRETGKEHEQEATEILDIQITKREEN